MLRSKPAALFAAALGKTRPEDRQALLAEACAGAPARLARIESLLHAHEHPDSFLEPPQGVDGLAFRESVTEQAGTVIGGCCSWLYVAARYLQFSSYSSVPSRLIRIIGQLRRAATCSMCVDLPVP